MDVSSRLEAKAEKASPGGMKPALPRNECRLLVIDDDEDFAESMRDVFEPLGYTVRTAYSSTSALTVAREFLADVALIDVKLGHTSGVDLIVPLREVWPSTQCVMMTGYAAMESAVQALRLDAIDYLHKPIDLEVLRTTVERCASLVRLQRENRLAHEAVERSEQKYRRLVESLRDEYFFYSSDREHILTYVSPSVHNVLGYDAASLHSLWEHQAPTEGNREAFRLHQQVLAGSPQLPYELSVVHADGGVRRLRVLESPVANEAGQVIGVDGMAHDITERMESQERFRRLANATQEAIVIHAGTSIIEANEVFFEMFRVSPEALEKVDLLGIWTPDSRVIYQSCLTAPQGGASSAGCEIQALRTGGEAFPVAVSVRNIPRRGKVVQVTAIRDLTAQRSAEEKHRQVEAQLRQAQKMEAIGQLTGGIAHDFNNMLQGILGYADLLEMRIGSGRTDSLLEFVEQIRAAGARASDLIAQLLVYSRGGTAESKPMQISRGVEAAVKLVRSTFPRNVELAVGLKAVPAIKMDAIQLQQVIMNLCINARDACAEKGGRIEVSIQEANRDTMLCASCGLPFRGRFVEVTVRDDGVGMTPELMTRIFDPFFTTKEVGKGTGMGLPVAHGVVHEHGGHILVESEVGSGTIFHLYFPPSADLAVEPPEVEREARAKDRRGRGRILVVDDEVLVTDYLRVLLRDAGYEVTTLNDPKEALARFARNPGVWDLVVTDQMMPGMTGDKLAAGLLALRPELPIILCTAYAEGLDEARASSLRFRGFLRKPWEAQMALRLIAELLGGGSATLDRS